MVHILIGYVDDKVRRIEVDGHADSGPYGNDLVCAAISAVVVGCSNALLYPESFVIEIKPGHYLLKDKLQCLSADYNVVRALYICLKTIADKYPRFVEMKEREI